MKLNWPPSLELTLAARKVGTWERRSRRVKPKSIERGRSGTERPVSDGTGDHANRYDFGFRGFGNTDPECRGYPMA